MTIVREEDGEEVRRSYSICVPARSGELAVGVRHLPGGRFSFHVADGLKVGDLLDVLPPAGRFGPEIQPASSRHHAFVAAGSGITPVISIVATVLAEEPGSNCTVVYGNRRTDTIMFVEELEDLKNRYPSRLQLVHVLSRESQPVPLLEGRLGAERLGALLDALVPPDDRRRVVPVRAVRDGPGRPGAPAGARRGPPSTSTASCSTPTRPRSRRPPPTEARNGAATVTIVLDGRRSTFPVDGGWILEAALRNRPDAPYACKGGVCGTCRCRIVEGEVAMDHSYALEEDEIEAGVVLACQSHPRSERIVLDFDAR